MYGSLFALVLSWSALGCVPTTEVVIELDGDERIDGATIDITVVGPDGEQVLPSQELDSARLPLELPLVPRGLDAARRFMVAVRVATDPERVLRLRGRFEADKLLRARVWITPAPACPSAEAISSRCAVRLRSPADGAFTGSVHAARALAPTFRWDEVPGAERYELELDGSCGDISPALCPFHVLERASASSGTEVTLDTPLSVSRVQPVGQRYVWRVRACAGDACSAWSEPRALEVGRQRSDFDGDGYADIVAAAPNSPDIPTSFGQGRVFRWAGAPDATTLARAPDQTLGPVPCRLGHGLAAIGDADGDGYPDLAASTTRDDILCYAPHVGGAVLVYYGGPEGFAGPSSDVAIPSPAAALAPEMDIPRFGYGLSTAGDLDRDGLADIAVPTGEALRFYLAREDRTFVAHTALPSPARQPRTSCCADLDGDGRGDLAAARMDGAAIVSDGALVVLDAPAIAAPEVVFSMDVAIADVDADGHAELFAAACVDNYMIAGVAGGGTWVSSGSGQPFIPVLPSIPVTTSNFYGCQLSSLGDVDGDGRGDIGVTAPATRLGGAGGQAIVWLAGSGPSLALIGSATNAGMGGSVAGVGDIDGDGLDDVVAGSPRETLPGVACSCDVVGKAPTCSNCPAGTLEIFLGRPDFAGGPSDVVLSNPVPANNADLGEGLVEAFP